MSRYFLIWITFLFLGLAYQRGEMISLSLVLRTVPKSVHIGLTVLGHFVALATLAILVWYGFRFAEVNTIQTLPAFDFVWASIAGENAEANVSAWWLYASVPVGAALLAIHLIFGLFRRIRRIATDLPVFEEDIEHEPTGEGTR